MQTFIAYLANLDGAAATLIPAALQLGAILIAVHVLACIAMPRRGN